MGHAQKAENEWEYESFTYECIDEPSLIACTHPVTLWPSPAKGFLHVITVATLLLQKTQHNNLYPFAHRGKCSKVFQNHIVYSLMSSMFFLL